MDATKVYEISWYSSEPKTLVYLVEDNRVSCDPIGSIQKGIAVGECKTYTRIKLYDPAFKQKPISYVITSQQWYPNMKHLTTITVRRDALDRMEDRILEYSCEN